ncbi:MAG: TorF family putative porin [Pseudomonadota bacterium]
MMSKTVFATLPLRLLSAALLLASAAVHAEAPAPEAAKPAPDWVITGNASMVSDYVFRGVTQTQGKPTGQFNIDWTHAQGLYFGTFGSGVSHAAYNNGSGSEIDLYGGYRYPLAADTNIDLGLVTYWYAGAHYAADGRDIKYHTQDLKLGYNGGAFNAYGWLTVSRNWFGFAIDPANGNYTDTRGTTYFEANWNPEIAPGSVVNLHIGRQNVRHLEDFNFFDLKVGITKTWDNWVVSASAIHNNGIASKGGAPYWTWFDADGASKVVVGNRLLVTAGRNF